MIAYIYLVASVVDLSPLPNVSSHQNSFITTIIGIVIKVLAGVSLLMVTIGGFRYILSQGDPQGVSKAKGTIIYALIGLIVAVLAQAIVSFIIGSTS